MANQFNFGPNRGGPIDRPNNDAHQFSFAAAKGANKDNPTTKLSCGPI